MACRAVAFCSLLTFLMVTSAVFAADVGLRFASSPESIVVPPGDEVMFECSLNVTAEKAEWRHRGKTLDLDSSPLADEVADLEEGSARLQGLDLVIQVSRDPRHYADQAGEYQCVASFGPLRMASKPAQLTIAEMREFPEKRDESYTVAPGNTVAFHCEPPYSKPPAVIEFFHNKSHSAASRQRFPMAGESTLVLSNVTQLDSGSYSCKASNFIGVVYSHHRIHLQVVKQGNSAAELQAPHFLKSPTLNYTAVIGSNVTLECAPVGHPPPLVKWHKYGGELPKDRARIIPGGLQLIKVGHGDEGTYLCKASNKAGSIADVIIQLSLEEPPTIVKEPSNTDVEEGGNIELECLARGIPTPAISWLFNGEAVESDSLIKVEGDKLKVQNVQLRHAGIVQCFATNHLDSVFGSAMLSVRPKLHRDNSSGDFGLPDLMHNKGFEDPLLIPTPSSGGKKHGKKKDKTRKGKGRRKDKKHKAVMVPPSQPNVTRLTDESVMLRWEVPENDGLKIQFFKVQYKDMGSGKGWNTIDDDIPPHIRSYEVRNLIINHIYRFRIAAVYTNNDNLLGRNSVRFHMQEPTTKKPPYPPTLTLTEAVSPSAIRIEWEYLDADAIPIEGFIIYYRATTNAGEYTKASVEENTRSYIITHLLPSTFYDIQIKSFNNAGASDSSSVFTTRTLDSEVTAPKREDGVSDSGENTTTPPTYSNNDQLYMVLGTVLGGGLVLLLLLFLALYNCRQRQNALQASGAHDIHDIYQTSTRDVGFNGNGIGNGHTQNGYLPQGKLNITNNPLSETDEDKNKNVMESSFMHRKNHSCPMAPAPEHLGHSQIQRGGNEVESEESTPSSSLDVEVVLCHQISDASSSCVESPSSPSWLKQKSVMGREDYV